MAFTLTKPGGTENTPSHVGQLRRVIRDIVVSSYTTSGETITAATFGLQKIIGISQLNVGTTALNTRAVYNSVDGKLWLFTGAGVQNASGAGGAATVRVEVVGY